MNPDFHKRLSAQLESDDAAERLYYAVRRAYPQVNDSTKIAIVNGREINVRIPLTYETRHYAELPTRAPGLRNWLKRVWLAVRNRTPTPETWARHGYSIGASFNVRKGKAPIEYSLTIERMGLHVVIDKHTFSEGPPMPRHYWKPLDQFRYAADLGIIGGYEPFTDTLYLHSSVIIL